MARSGGRSANDVGVEQEQVGSIRYASALSRLLGGQTVASELVDLGIEGFVESVEIGRGGFGAVYRAYQPKFGRTVAIKVLFSRADSRARLNFERECRILGSLSGHPNIVYVFDAGQTSSGQPYLVMAHMPGGALADRLARSGPLDWWEATDIVIRLAGALETAHARGVLHRDIKPENVLMSEYGDPQLADFGLARLRDHVSTTRDGGITATFAHAPPEIIAGQQARTASDVYSLGSTLYTLVTGVPPFERESDESWVPMLARIASEPVPDLRLRGAPPSLAAIVEQTMHKEPEERPRSAGGLGRLLQGAQREAGLAETAMPLEPGHSDEGASAPPTEPVSGGQPPHAVVVAEPPLRPLDAPTSDASTPARTTTPSAPPPPAPSPIAEPTPRSPSPAMTAPPTPLLPPPPAAPSPPTLAAPDSRTSSASGKPATAQRSSPGAIRRRRSRVIVVLAIVVVLTGVGVVVAARMGGSGGNHPSNGQGGDDRAVAQHIEDLLERNSLAVGQVTSTVDAVYRCGTNAQEGSATVSKAIEERRSILGDLGTLDTGPLAEGPALTSLLNAAVESSISDDMHYIQWMKYVTDQTCTGGQAPLDNEFGAAQAGSMGAGTPRAQFADAWVPIADRFGLRHWAAKEL